MIRKEEKQISPPSSKAADVVEALHRVEQGVAQLAVDTGADSVAPLSEQRAAGTGEPQNTRNYSYYEHLIASSLDMVITVDPDRRIVEFNTAAERCFGYRRDEVLGKPVDMLYADPGNGKSLSRQALEQGFCGEVRNRRRNGEEFYCYVSASPIRDSNGRFLGLMGISRDITEQKRTQEALRVAHDQLARMNEQLESLVSERTRALHRAYEDLLDGLVFALDAREHATMGHSRRVSTYCVFLAIEHGVPHAELEQIYRGALLHDVGKIGIADAVLLKPGKLTPDERQHIEEHVAIGAKVLGHIECLAMCLDIPRYHHERYAGGGYLAGISGVDIPLAARLFAVIDVYDALRSDRPYKAAMSHTEATAIIESESGKHFDPRIVQSFLRVDAAIWEALRVESLDAERFPDVLSLCERLRTVC